jgi:hypothetical protein
VQQKGHLDAVRSKLTKKTLLLTPSASRVPTQIESFNHDPKPTLATPTEPTKMKKKPVNRSSLTL